MKTFDQFKRQYYPGTTETTLREWYADYVRQFAINKENQKRLEEWNRSEHSFMSAFS